MYDVIYLGRFHHQKGVLELMDIWEIVTKLRPESTLVMVGDGKLYQQCLMKAKGNVEFVGCKYGKERDEIIRNSRVVVHPATYDSGGMSMAECMAFGLPGVCFNLSSLSSYYEKGVLKVDCFDKEQFAMGIVSLLTDEEFYNSMGEEAAMYIKTEWNWEMRSNVVWKAMMSHLSPQQVGK